MWDPCNLEVLPVARGVLIEGGVKSLVRSLVLAGALLGTVGGGLAAAAPADDRAVEVGLKDIERQRLDGERADLDRRFHAALAEVDALKKQRSSWANDRKLDAKQRQAQELGKALGAKTAALAAVDRTLVDRRRALVTAINAELAAGVTDATRRAKLERQRAEAQRRLPETTRKLKVPDDRIDPLDDPEDLDDKAKRLVAGEKSLQAEIARMDRRARALTQVAVLEKSRQRASEDLFQDAQKGRRTAYASGGSTGTGAPGGRGTLGDAEADNGGGGGAAAPPPGAGAPGDGFGGLDPSPPASPTVTGADDSAGGTDPAVAYADVVDAGTIEALRQAERSTDPAVKAKAAERAKRDLEQKLTKLRARRLEMERRARTLRSED